MSRFFIDRPILAWVLAALVMLAGLLALRSLPIAQFPDLAPPSISVTALYRGADPETLANTTTQIIEQQMKGIDGLRYMASTADTLGRTTVTLTFEQGTNVDTAQVQVQNKLQLATARLPREVQQTGLTVAKATNSILLVLAIYSSDGSHSSSDVADFVASRVQDPVSRVTGVGEIRLVGGQYAMRIWADPFKLRSYGLTFGDVKNAIQAQNAQVAAGQIGSQPAAPGQPLAATVSAQSRLKTVDQFEAIILRTNPDGSTVTISDVARVEIGNEDYNFDLQLNGKPGAGILMKLAPGANALDTVDRVKAEVAKLQRQFPPDLRVAYPLDSTPFVRLSVKQVVETIVESTVLVFLVMFLFLQSFRATLIPTIAIPVVLLGTLAILLSAGYSINTLTLFGMVLAIGLLVDDAIVVVENVERIMEEEGLSPREATIKSMGEISGALIAIAMVLAAVFVPMAFFGGSSGVVYRQFSITVVSAMGLSVLVALVLTPALCATLLRPHGTPADHRSGFFGWFNRRFNRASQRYEQQVARLLGVPGRALLGFAVICVLLAVLFARLPGGFLPNEDQGFMFAQVRMPPGTTLDRTAAVMKQVQAHYLNDEAANVEAVFSVTGFSSAGGGQNIGQAFISLKPWAERPGEENSAQAIAGRANAAFQKFSEGMAFAFVPPAALELGNATGFSVVLTDENNLGHERMVAARDQFIAAAAKDPRLMGVRIFGQKDVSQLQIDVDFAKAGAYGLTQAEINDTISTAWGGTYVNDFIDRGRLKHVYVQADAPFRSRPEDLQLLHVRGVSGAMAPLGEVATTRWKSGPALLERFNGTPSFQIDGQAAPGYSSGDALRAVEELAASTLPPGVGHSWTGLSYEEAASAGQAPALYALSVLIVFLCLAALYESLIIPVAVLLVVPLGAIGALLAATMTGLANDVFFQVGLVTTVGVSTKNAILIVEFAAAEMRAGRPLREAAIRAARLRLRPILMTSLAFVFGVLPLAIATGAGSGGQNAIGRSVAGGMISATVLAIFFVPLFFVVVKKLFHQEEKVTGQHSPAATPAAVEG